MKKFIFLLVPLLLICRCNENADNSDDNSNVDPVPTDEETLFNNFENKLSSLEGQVNSSTSSLVRTIDMMYGDQVSLRMISTDKATTTRYTYNNSYVVEKNGTAAYLDDDGITVDTSSAYQIQIYDDKANFYQVTKYEEDDWVSDNSSKTIAYSNDSVSAIYNIGFALNDISNIEFMKSVKNNLKYDYTYTNFEGNMTGNKLIYGYVLNIYTIYDGGVKSISQKITYDNTLTINDGVVTSLSQKYTNTLYYAEIATQCAYVTYNVTYQQGDYSEFTGTILPH